MSCGTTGSTKRCPPGPCIRGGSNRSWFTTNCICPGCCGTSTGTRCVRGLSAGPSNGVGVHSSTRSMQRPRPLCSKPATQDCRPCPRGLDKSIAPKPQPSSKRCAGQSQEAPPSARQSGPNAPSAASDSKEPNAPHTDQRRPQKSSCVPVSRPPRK